MGIFQPATSYRMPLDKDGSVGFYFSTGSTTPSTMSSSQMYNWNDESSSTSFGNPAWQHYWAGYIFPEMRDIEGYLVAHSGGDTYQDLQTSVDTTNGYDGTWVTRDTSPSRITSLPNGWFRENVTGINVTGVKAIRYRVKGNSGCGHIAFHLYGKYSTGENPNRLEFWDPSVDQRLAVNALDPGDGGDIVQGQTYTSTFRVKNLSSTMTATNTLVTVETLTDGSPSIPPQIEFDDGGGYAPSVTIPSLAPGGISSVITMRYNVDPNAQNLARTPRLTAIPQSYS